MRHDLVEAASRGDHEAFEVLATSAGDRLYAVARLILRSADLAEDCDGGAYSLSSDRWYQTTGQTDDMWILDIDGERRLIVASDAPGTPADVTAQLEAMVASMEIEPLAAE